MAFMNDKTASGVIAYTTAPGAVNLVALQVIVAGNVTFTDSLGNVTALTAVPAGTRIDACIVNLSVNTATVLGYLP